MDAGEECLFFLLLITHIILFLNSDNIIFIIKFILFFAKFKFLFS